MKTSLKFIGLTFLSVSASMALAAGKKGEHAKGVQDLIDATGGQAQVSVDRQSGHARFIRLPVEASSANDSRAPRSLVAPPEQRAMSFMRSYGNAFGVTDAKSQLKAAGTKRDAMGNQHSVLQQAHNGLPVFGGELRAHFNANGDLFAVNGVFVSDLKVNTVPSLKTDEAEARALRAVVLHQVDSARASAEMGAKAADPDLALENLMAASSRLMVFRSGLIQGVPGRDHLAYEVEVVNAERTVREFVYVDAHNGKAIDQITGIHDALDRVAYDAEGFAAPGPNYPATPFWVESDPFPTSSVEADNMIVASGDTYGFFSNAFGRDSFDDAGATMISIFNRGNGCPNASWNGTFISFCPGLTTDDITGHEWAHAYTDYTNNLIYQWQSGALNESYSDIWGETVDLINGREGLALPVTPRTDGSCSDFGAGGPGDNSIKWLLGEDWDAIRDMWNPNCYGDPGKVTDSEYWCGPGDSGGVHINSGVPNRAYSLMVDGGNFNGYAITGLGLTKAAHIQWAAQNLLTPSSNFADNADALEAACSALIGIDLNDLLTGAPSGEIIDAGDCAQVADINAAVEFRTPPVGCGFEPLLAADAPALCEGEGSVQTIMSEDFEGGALPAGWTASSHDVANPATFDSPGWSVETGLPSGNGSSYSAFAPDLIEGNCAGDTEAGVVNLDSPVISLPVGEVPHVAFDHWVATEAGWDGGNVKLSVNGGPWTVIPSSYYSFNPYNGTIIVSDNPLGGEEGFTGTDGGSVSGSWGQSQVDLYGLALPGDDVQLRFDLGTDGCNGIVGWYVDNVNVYSCSDEALPICGDGSLDRLEVCDDGNMVDGDGCSSACEVESGWECADAIPFNPAGTNVVGDWSFEAGYPNPDWTPFNDSGLGLDFLPICDAGSCGVPLANTGHFYVWIGGFSTGVTASVEQSLVIPSTATELTLWTRKGLCSPVQDDVLHVSLDGADIGTITCDDRVNGYFEYSFPVAGFNDDAAHTLLIGGTTTGDGTAWTNFFVDDVTINDNVPTEAVPSICKEIVFNLACNAGPVGFTEGIPSSWSVVDNEGTGLVWTDIANSEIGGNWTGGTGDAASLNSDAFIFVEYDSELISNPFSLQNQASAALDYLVNYHNTVPGRDFLDVDITTDGGSNWTNLLSWSEDHGGFYSTPGQSVSIDLAAYLGEPEVQVRWHFYNPNSSDWDWYAQVDNVALNAPDDADCDGVVDSLDACPGTMIPETAPANGLGRNRWVLLDGDTTFDTVGKQSPAYTLQDTAGCSCEQIIEGLGLGDGHAKFGCSNSNMKAWIEMLNQ